MGAFSIAMNTLLDCGAGMVRRWRRKTAPARLISRRRPRLLFVLLVESLALAPQLAIAQDYQAGEYEIKAAFLCNFTKFVEWPSSAYSDSRAPLQLCILGRDPFGSALQQVIADRSPNARPLLVRHLRRSEEFRTCQVLFISSSEWTSAPRIFKSLEGASVLTVGDADHFAEKGGVIELFLVNKQIRLVINPAAASRGGLHISSKLLALAQIVSN
jgi:uncharacterized protein DUF4154